MRITSRTIALAAGGMLFLSNPVRAEEFLGSILPPEPFESADYEPDVTAWDAPEPVRALIPDTTTLVLGASDTAPRHRDAGRPFSRTLLIIQGLEKMGEFMPLAQGPAGLLRRYYDATHTDRYSIDIRANPIRDDYRIALKIKV